VSAIGYAAFLEAKVGGHPDAGFRVDVDELPSFLFVWQAEIVQWALRKGRCAIFADTGLGKTGMQLAWAHAVAKRTQGRVLILAPLAVSAQTAREADRWGLPVAISRDGSEQDWIEWAAPVWYRATPGYPAGIRETDVLNVSHARDDRDERHLCPLQLGVIERAVRLYSNPGDVVLSPFGGIGSEGVGALRHGRRFVGIELKRSYFETACRNLQGAEGQLSLLSEAA
jgi:hypothetical protein